MQLEELATKLAKEKRILTKEESGFIAKELLEILHTTTKYSTATLSMQKAEPATNYATPRHELINQMARTVATVWDLGKRTKNPEIIEALQKIKAKIHRMDPFVKP